MSSYLEELNQQQRNAVEHTEGPLLIVAGAGTGKTKTLTYRVYHLIRTGVHPSNILAITFTNKASQEMKERIHGLMRRNDPAMTQEKLHPSQSPFVSTFHALGVYLLRAHADKIGKPRSFSILDATDQRALLKEAMDTLGINPKQWEPRTIAGIISKNKGDLLTPDELQQQARSSAGEISAMVWREYEELLDRNSACDFDDLLVKSYELLRDYEDITQVYRNRFRYIHIDEYQDTNTAQYRISKLLAEQHRNICAVGDSDQNIYSWRGADMKNILRFEQDYPEAKIILLEKNYRSTQTILAGADAIIQKNTARIPKKLMTDNEEGFQIKIYKGFSENDEARFVVEQVGRSLALGTQADEIAVLFRTNFQSRALEEAFLYAGIPYHVLGVKFFERKEVKDVLAFLRLARNPNSLTDIKRIINIPKRGIGKVTLIKILSGNAQSLPKKMQEKYADFQKILHDIAKVSREEIPSNVIRFILEKTGLKQILSQGTDEDKERYANLQELVTYATKYDQLPLHEGIDILLEDASLMGEQDSLTITNETKRVRLMTIHASKGLEFDHVFITGLEQGLFPSQRERESTEDAEEERRLMYVAMTRAKRQLYFSYAQMRRIFGEQKIQIPSEFINDIPEDLVELLGDFGSSDPEKIIYLDF